MFRHDLKNQLGRAGRSIRETQAAGPVDFGSGILNFGFIVCNAPAGDDSAGPLGTHLPILDLGFWISDFRSGLRLPAPMACDVRHRRHRPDHVK